jgi:Zn-dependent protease with chaperone function
VAIQLSCAPCQRSFKVAERFAGKRVKCPKCQTVIDVPLAATVAAAAYDAKSASAETTAPPADSDRPTPAPPAELMDMVVFAETITPVQRTLLYRLGLALTGILMVLLPIVYLVLIGAVAYLVYWHTTENIGILTGASLPVGGRAGLLLRVALYLGPLLGGVILLGMMVKPFLAGPGRALKLKALKRSKEPALFALVQSIARAVGAPEPKRIEVSADVNASAGFATGLGGFFGGQLVLTIGLPLAAGLSVSELAGVIAHELGHFSQGAGMRFSYLVRRVNEWFARLVYERDHWDDLLVQLYRESGVMCCIAALALMSIWCVRRILWVILALASAISFFMLRQMEYDADKYETRLAGTETFTSTTHKLLALNTAWEQIFVALLKTWRYEKPPGDLPATIVQAAESIPAKELRRARKKALKLRTGLFDTHPADKDRIASAEKEDAPGIFHCDEPATSLFTDFTKLSRGVTEHYYLHVIGSLFGPLDSSLTATEFVAIVAADSRRVIASSGP